MNVLSKTRENQCHAQLGLPDKENAIKLFVVFNGWNLERLDLHQVVLLKAFLMSNCIKLVSLYKNEYVD